MAVISISEYKFVYTFVTVSLARSPRSSVVRLKIHVFITILDFAKYLSKVIVPVFISTNYVVRLFKVIALKWGTIIVLTFNSLSTGKVEHLFMY